MTTERFRLFVSILVGIALSSLTASAAPTSDVGAVNQLVIHADQGRQTINRNIYGQFSEHLGRCIYGGLWVDKHSPIPNTRGIRNDIVAALHKIKIPVLRWPGGCFADEYHWMDGIGPYANRPTMINTHWGGVTEDNHFGTHEFMDLCQQLGCEPYICGNVGSGTVREMQQWVEYITSDGVSPMTDLRKKNGHKQPWKLTYFGVGNENWGCGGNMTPEYYANEFRRYATYVRNFDSNRVFKIACGSNGGDTNWTEVLMRNIGRRMNGLSLHYYTLPSGNWSKKGSATDFQEAEWHATLRRALEMDNVVTRHSAIMDKYDAQKRIGLIVDEWGAWYDVEPGMNPGFLYQQSTLRDALVAGVTLNIFNQHCDRVRMANIAQMINVLQAMILTDKEKMLLTPTYHVFEMYTVHHDATLLPTELKCANYESGRDKIPALSVSASRDKAGKIHVSLCNLNPNATAEVNCTLSGAQPKAMSGRVLTAETMQAHNTFEKTDAVKPGAFNAFKLTGDGFTATLPAKSVVVLEVE